MLAGQLLLYLKQGILEPHCQVNNNNCSRATTYTRLDTVLFALLLPMSLALPHHLELDAA